MIKLLTILLIIAFVVPVSMNTTSAQIPIIDVITGAVKKAIKAIDLQIQRQQNKVIWLQNAQKVLENAMSQTKLTEIAEWVTKQKALYQNYYAELRTVKAIISYYHRIKEMAEKQVHLVGEYKKAWALFLQDKHFTADELTYMGGVYSGILKESAKNIDQVYLVISSFRTEMSDANRLEIINAAADRTDQNYYDLKTFNQQGIMLSLQRAKAQNDVDIIEKLYGLQ